MTWNKSIWDIFSLVELLSPVLSVLDSFFKLVGLFSKSTISTQTGFGILWLNGPSNKFFVSLYLRKIRILKEFISLLLIFNILTLPSSLLLRKMNSLICLRRNLLSVIFPFIDLSEEARNWMLFHRASFAGVRHKTYQRLIANIICPPSCSVITKCESIDIWRFASSEFFL